MIFLLTKKNVLFVVGSIASAFVGMLITILIARLYSKDINANYQYYLTFLQIVSLLGWARADQFLTSVKFPPNLNTVIIYLVKNQYLNWVIVFICSIFFKFYTGEKFIDNYFYLLIVLISGYLFGVINISNQYLIIGGRYEYQGLIDLSQKVIFFFLLFLFSSFSIYLGILMLISMLFRLVIFQFVNNELLTISDGVSLKVMISNGRRMLLANIFNNVATFLIVYLISKQYSKSFYADYSLVLILTSFPASIVGQYIGLLIHRRYVNGNKDFIMLFKLVLISSFFLIIVYTIIPQFKFLIIELIGVKWSTIWDIYGMLWPLSIFTFLASILERTGYEFGNKKWPIFISFLRFLGIFILVAISHVGSFLLDSDISYFYMIAFILYFTYMVDLFRNMIILYRESLSSF